MITLPSIFFQALSWDKEKAILYHNGKEFTSLSSKQFYEEVSLASYGLRKLGIDWGDRVAILAETSHHWLIMDLAILSLGGITVPLYPTWTSNYILDLLKRSKAKGCFFSNLKQLEKVLPYKGDLTHLEILITREKLQEGVLSFEELKELGKKYKEETKDDFKERAYILNPDQVATIIFTSGTTGNPKGVMLTHKNIACNVEEALKLFDIGPKDVTLSFLPLSHILERMVTYAYLKAGATIGYARSLETLSEDFLLVKPTIFVAVPRLYEKIISTIREKVEKSKIKEKIFLKSRKVAEEVAQFIEKNKNIPLDLKLKRAFFNFIVYKKIYKNLGGRLRFCISGGAPLNKDILAFLLGAGITIYEGYGLTETSPVISANYKNNLKLGSVGKVFKNLEVKIEEDGEILVKGPSVFKGYLDDPVSTAEVFAPNGFFKTGDIGYLDEEGYLFITDRKKDLIITAGGKNIAPQPIENRIKEKKGVSFAIIIGDKRPYPICLIVPDFNFLREWAKKKGISELREEELITNPEVKEYYFKIVEESIVDLASYEKPKKVGLIPEEFSIEKDFLTPTLKVKRKKIEEKFSFLIDSLYNEE
ncbi:MAG: long-chain fatty acid--CoA ligase [Thermoanaerobaculia bacterium]